MLAALPLAMRAQESAERELSEVRGRLEALEKRLAESTRERDDGQNELRRLELAAAAARAELEEIRLRLDAQRARASVLADEEAAAINTLADEQHVFAEQVRMSYMTGQQEVFKLLLSQENPAELGRMLTYFDYLNRARGERIDTVGRELGRINALAAEASEVRQSLQSLEAAQRKQIEQLAERRDERRNVLAVLDAGIANTGDELATLRAEERRLAELVEALALELARFPVDAEAPFAEWRGRLNWPVEGRALENYGTLREGGPLRWNGVLLEAEPGTLVRAVYHGRVAFADWLPGLGLLVILDHGDGYMSLYGHNETLLREPGDWVQPGEAVGQVGDTGGRSVSALYFEIRHDGAPVNPNAWIQ
jgi:septal ring factor EnvC (AmiA/AmiB activator)